SACHVAVQRAVTDSEFALVSSRQNEVTEFVRERHQDHCAQARLHIFFRLVFGKAFENFLELGLENLKRVGDWNLKKFYAQTTRERPRVLDAAARRVRAWHGNAGYILRTQRIGGNGCSNSGINSTAQTDHDRVEVAFAAVIAEPERKRGKNLLRYFALVKFDGRSRICINDSFLFTKCCELRDHIPRWIHREGVTVEDQLVVAAYQIAVA